MAASGEGSLRETQHPAADLLASKLLFDHNGGYIRRAQETPLMKQDETDRNLGSGNKQGTPWPFQHVVAPLD